MDTVGAWAVFSTCVTPSWLSLYVLSAVALQSIQTITIVYERLEIALCYTWLPLWVSCNQFLGLFTQHSWVYQISS